MVDNGRGPQPCNMLLTLQTAGLTADYRSHYRLQGSPLDTSLQGQSEGCGDSVGGFYQSLAGGRGWRYLMDWEKSVSQTSLSDDFYMILKHLSLLSRSKRSRQFAYKLTLFVQ